MTEYLSHLPLVYLKYLSKMNDKNRIFKINGKNVFEDTDKGLYEGEIFKKHPIQNGIYVSNFGRIKIWDEIEIQKIEGNEYLYIEYAYKISNFDEDIKNSSKINITTPIAYSCIDIDKNAIEKKGEKYIGHPFLRIFRNTRNMYFSIGYDGKKYFYDIKKGKKMDGNYDDIIIIPTYTYRLVAETWLPNPNIEIYNMVHHIINNGYNNTIYNLMWVSDAQHKIIERR